MYCILRRRVSICLVLNVLDIAFCSSSFRHRGSFGGDCTGIEKSLVFG